MSEFVRVCADGLLGSTSDNGTVYGSLSRNIREVFQEGGKEVKKDREESEQAYGRPRFRP